MIYPNFLKKNDTIGITAPSAGVGHKLYDFDRSLNVLKERGFHIIETASVRNDNERSADAPTRAKELNELFDNPKVNMVMCASGGDFLDEILPYVNFDSMQNNPKWLMGASDPTGILYPYTCGYDVATIYGCNAGSYDLVPLKNYLEDNLQIIQGNLLEQKSSPRCLSKAPFLVDDLSYDIDSKWQSNVSDLVCSGRCIGGCIDVLKDFIGTKFDYTKDFIERYAKDGIIWYFDNFACSSEVLYRTFLQFRYAGWFENTKAILIGRTCLPHSDTGMNDTEAITRAFPDIPVFYQADIGHTLPHMTMINGATLHFQFKEEKATLSFKLD